MMTITDLNQQTFDHTHANKMCPFLMFELLVKFKTFCKIYGTKMWKMTIVYFCLIISKTIIF